MSLIAWYPLNGNTLDYSGNNNAINNGATIDNSGKIGKCYSFTQTGSDGINIPNKNFTELIDNYSMSIWVNPLGTHYHYNGTFISSGDWNKSCWAFGVSQDNNKIDVLGKGYNTYIDYSVPLNTWTHITCVVKNNISKVYVNGSYVGERSVVSALSSDASNTYIGRETYASGYFSFNGKLNDLRIYDHALSTREIKELSRAKILHYTFDNCEEPTENLIPQNKQTFEGWYKYGGTSATLTQGVAIPGITQNGATRIQTTGGSGADTYLKYYFSAGTFSGSDSCSISVWIYNCGSTIVRLTGNAVTGSVIVNPGEIKYATISRKAPGIDYGDVQLRFGAYTNSTDSLDFIAFQPQIEKKDYATPFTPSYRQGIIMDISGYRNNATLTLNNTPQWVEDGKLGNGSYNFDGTNKAIYLPIVPINEFTFSFWFYKNEWSSDPHETLFGGTSGFELESKIGSTNSPVLKLYSWGGGTVPYEMGKWNHIVFTRTTSQTQLYLNGILVLTGTAGSIPSGIYLGSWRDYNTQNYKGLIDDFRIYQSVLSPDDIFELYQTRMQLDDIGNLYTINISENYKPFPEIKSSLNSGTLYGILNSYTQTNCQVSLVNDYTRNCKYSYRIFRDPNLVYPAAGTVMWGGVILNFDNYRRFISGKKYKVTFYYLGQTSGAMTDALVNYSAGWTSMGVGLTNGASLISSKLIPSNFNDWDNWHYGEAVFQAGDLYQTGTDSIIYYCMRNLKLGWNYYSTGSLGTDIRITDIDIQEINDGEFIGLSEKGIFSCNQISEIGITDGLIAYYPLDKNSNDYSGNNNNGTLVNSPVPTSGLNQLAYQFDGSTNYINIPGNSILEPTSITISAWIYMDTDAPTGRNIFLTKWNGYSCEIEGTTRRPYFRLNGPGDAYSSENLVLGQWYYFVGTFTNGVGSKIYLNGELRGQKSTTTPISYTSNAVLNIGRYAGGVYFKGKIQDVRIYNRELSQEEIRIMYDLRMGNATMKVTPEGNVYINNEVREV